MTPSQPACPIRPLTVGDFVALVRHLTNGREPFPWQTALAEKVLEEGWESVETITVPTGCGKTMILAVQAFCLAANAHLQPDDPKRHPLRMFFVVDRRVVVDDSARLAREIARLVNDDAPPDDLRPIAERLRSLGVQRPIAAVTLRGGLPTDDTWMLEPHQPALVISTVDQVGSKLLFRAYRASKRSSPIHAGLAGFSSLIVLDEAHLSRPFSQTISNARRLGADIRVVTMTATPPAGVTSTFRLTSRDEENEVLQLRLNAKKAARVLKVESSGDPDKDRDRLVATIAHSAAECLTSGSNVRVLGVMVNTVARARGVFQHLQNHVGPDAHLLLLTGRIRPYDRDRLLQTWLPYIRADLRRPDPPDGKPVILVSTQTLEAGADVDLDSLVTESAPLDALRQRFGRLDRLGRRHRDQIATGGLIVHVEPPAKSKRPKGLEDAWDDPIYGEATAKTWGQLQIWAKQAGKGRGQPKDVVDFGLSSMKGLVDKLPIEEGKPTKDAPYRLHELCAPTSHAPTLFPAHLDAWSATRPRPAADPDPAVFLHGAQSGPPDVYVVWRDWPDDFRLISREPSTERNRWERATFADLGLLPPSTGEMLAVPIGAARTWLRVKGTVSTEVADVEGQPAAERPGPSPRNGTANLGRPAVLGRPGEWRIGFGDDIYPGDIIVVPCGYGGADRYGWNPAEAALVQDVSGECSTEYRRRPAVRLSPEDTPFDDDEVDDTAIRSIAATRLAAADPSWVRTARLFRRPPRIGGGVLLLARRQPQGTYDVEVETDEADSRHPDDLSLLGREITLGNHSLGVAARVERFSQHLGLPVKETEDLKLVGLLHDLGKADERFQLMLHSGDEIALTDALSRNVLLAKSHSEPEDREIGTPAETSLAWPEGLRHEYISVQLLITNPDSWKHTASDPELVMWLTGIHHGYGRPWWPACHDEHPPDLVVSVPWMTGSPTFRITGADRRTLDLRRPDRGWLDLFEEVLRRYGWWRLATFEAILRLADHRQSEAERRG